MFLVSLRLISLLDNFPVFEVLRRPAYIVDYLE